MNRRPILLALTASLVVGCGSESPDTPTDPRTRSGLTASELAAQPPTPADYRTIDWDALIPPEWSPDTLLSGYDLNAMDDASPQAETLMKKLQSLWKEAPVVPALDGQAVRLPGFVVPLELESESVGEFLLVPYYGACIHVPPPPRNQIVYVVAPPGKEYRGGVFDTVWVSGILKVESQSSDMGEAGYRLDAREIAPYAAPPETDRPPDG